MISKQDVKHMLQELRKTEIKMYHFYNDLIKQLHTSYYLNLLTMMRDEEKEHEEKVIALMNLLEKIKWE